MRVLAIQNIHNNCQFKTTRISVSGYSTMTDFAKFLGGSTSRPRRTAMGRRGVGGLLRGWGEQLGRGGNVDGWSTKCAMALAGSIPVSIATRDLGTSVNHFSTPEGGLACAIPLTSQRCSRGSRNGGPKPRPN